MTSEHGLPGDQAAPEAHGGPDAHGGGHDDGHDDGHGGAHGHGTSLGPVDVRMWGIGLLGVALGLVSAVVFAISTGRF